jgi:hypothetical protein
VPVRDRDLELPVLKWERTERAQSLKDFAS